MPGAWSQEEVEAVIADYFAMLSLELRQEHYKKSEHRRNLSKLLNGRSNASIERKHQNISAILVELGYPYISGYKPLGNYQALLYTAVAERLSSDATFVEIVQQAVAQSATVPTVEDLLSRLEQPPASVQQVSPPLITREQPSERAYPRINYLEQEARNASLGRAGEEFILNFERARLIRAGREQLAEQVEHTALTKGDGAGFDIRSFEVDGRDRLIEVKTTAYGKQVPFYVSRNEVAVSQHYREQYHLYRVFRFRDDPRLYTLTGSLDQVCALQPVQFIARLA